MAKPTKRHRRRRRIRPSVYYEIKRLLDEANGRISVKKACEMHGVSTQWYYDRRDEEADPDSLLSLGQFPSRKDIKDGNIENPNEWLIRALDTISRQESLIMLYEDAVTEAVKTAPAKAVTALCEASPCFDAILKARLSK